MSIFQNYANHKILKKNIFYFLILNRSPGSLGPRDPDLIGKFEADPDHRIKNFKKKSNLKKSLFLTYFEGLGVVPIDSSRKIGPGHGVKIGF